MSQSDDPRADYRCAIDAVFAGFDARHHLCKGRFDREVREPQRLIGPAREHGLLPPAERTVTVTGSKGKGTTARLIAHRLQAAGHRVGLVVTPEERDHGDRMRIDGEPIGNAEFARLFFELQPLIERAAAGAPAHWYASPTGIFLLVALAWFRERKVDWVVLEGGRGARYDEVGHVPARLAVLTSVLLEHKDRLGPTLADIAADKLSIAEHADHLIAAGACEPVVAGLPVWQRYRARTEFVAPGVCENLPAWYAQDAALAAAATDYLIGSVPPGAEVHSASFGHIARREGEIWFESLIHAASLDREFVARIEPGRCCAVVGLTDDKDWQGVAAGLREAGFASVRFVLLETGKGFLSSRRIGDAHGAQVCGVLPVDDDGSAARRLFDRLLREHGRLYVAGVQIFMRLLRNAYQVPLA